MKKNIIGFGIIIGLSSSVAFAGVSKELPYPEGKLNGLEIMEQTYFVNHFYGFKNMAITQKKSKKEITTLILRPKGSRPLTMSLERYLNNEYNDGSVNSKDLAIFRSGKLKGTGMLITDFINENKSQTYEIFIPSIRKVRRFAEPARDDAWGGSDFTFGDVTLRKPKHENHHLISEKQMIGCLDIMDLPRNHRNKYTKNIQINADCSVDGKNVYEVKSTPKQADWWYDSRVSYIDTVTFVDYRTEYFKSGDKIKVIDRSWVHAGLDDKRSNYWGYWYGKNVATGHETMAFIPKGITKVNHKYRKKNLWSTSTLRRMPKNIR